MEEKSREAMLAQRGEDFQKPKGGGGGELEPTDKWYGRRYDRQPTWWERGARGGAANYTAAIVNIAFALILLTEIVLWVKVALVWRGTSTPGYALAVFLPLLLPSLLLPLLAVLHSLTRGRLSYSSSLLLVLPPSPLLLHLLLIYRKVQGEEHHRISIAARGASLAQALLTSLPLTTLALLTLVRGTVDTEKVDMAMAHSHLFEHGLQTAAATVSLLNLLLAALRYNERQTGRAVSLLVGLPFLFTNLCLRLLGFALLFAYFDTLWILLFLGLHFCVSALAVQLGSGRTVCGRACRALLGVPGVEGEREQGVLAALLLSLANTALPAGYNRDRRLGHCTGRSWSLVVVSWLGGLALHGLVIHQTILREIPNVYMGLAPVDMSMLMPKTGLAVHLPNAMGGGFNVKLVLPETIMTMDAEHPASYELSTSHTQDMVVALALPLLLALLSLPFTVLRIILLGWNCSLSRQKEWMPMGLEEGEGRASRSRNCLTVCCGVANMVLFTVILVVVVGIYVLVAIHSNTLPPVRDLS